MNKKPKKRTPEEIAEWEATREARIRELRELAARGRAELDARRRARDAEGQG